jgi:hypothetical protein
MTQTGLIKKIIVTTKMENCNPNWVPATKEALRIDPEGEPMEEDWSNPSIVGMLLYLLTNMRPDIAFTISQVAGAFQSSPEEVACHCHQDDHLILGVHQQQSYYCQANWKPLD